MNRALLCLPILAACGQTIHTTPTEGEVLSESLFAEDNAVLSNEQLQKLLASRVELPKTLRLALVSHASEVDHSALLETVTSMKDTGRISSMAVLPKMLTPKPLTIPALRLAAARFRADGLILFKNTDTVFVEQNLFSPNEVRATSDVELLLVDVRSGTVPFASRASETKYHEQEDKDLNLEETIARCQNEAAKEALLAAAKDLATFLKTS